MSETGNMTEWERRLRDDMKSMEESIVVFQRTITFFKEEITKLHQARCKHLPQSGDDGANKYCALCGKKLE